MYNCATWQHVSITAPACSRVHITNMYTRAALGHGAISCPSPPRFCSARASPGTFWSICSISDSSLIPRTRSVSASSTSRVCFWTKPTRCRRRRDTVIHLCPRAEAIAKRSEQGTLIPFFVSTTVTAATSASRTVNPKVIEQTVWWFWWICLHNIWEKWIWIGKSEGLRCLEQKYLL